MTSGPRVWGFKQIRSECNQENMVNRHAKDGDICSKKKVFGDLINPI